MVIDEQQRGKRSIINHPVAHFSQPQGCRRFRAGRLASGDRHQYGRQARHDSARPSARRPSSRARRRLRGTVEARQPGNHPTFVESGKDKRRCPAPSLGCVVSWERASTPVEMSMERMIDGRSGSAKSTFRMRGPDPLHENLFRQVINHDPRRSACRRRASTVAFGPMVNETSVTVFMELRLPSTLGWPPRHRLFLRRSTQARRSKCREHASCECPVMAVNQSSSVESTPGRTRLRLSRGRSTSLIQYRENSEGLDAGKCRPSRPVRRRASTYRDPVVGTQGSAACADDPLPRRLRP